MRKALLGSTIVFFSLFIAGRFYLRMTDDFRMGSITYELPYHPEWETAPLPSQDQALLDEILGQEFFYIAKGAQCYAFESQDHKWILKFFKFKHLKPSLLVKYLPPVPPFKRYRLQKIDQKRKRLRSVFDAHILAYDVYKEESGIFYLHLNKSNKLKRSVKVFDKIGREWNIDLDPMVFVIQERAVKMRDEMTQILEDGNLDLAKDRIENIFCLYMKQYERGIYDWGHGVMHNNGFVGNKPIHFDVEKLRRDEKMKLPEFHREHLEKIARKMDLWIDLNYPEYREPLAHVIEERLFNIYHEEIIILEEI